MKKRRLFGTLLATLGVMFSIGKLPCKTEKVYGLGSFVFSDEITALAERIAISMDGGTNDVLCIISDWLTADPADGVFDIFEMYIDAKEVAPEGEVDFDAAPFDGWEHYHIETLAEKGYVITNLVLYDLISSDYGDDFLYGDFYRNLLDHAMQVRTDYVDLPHACISWRNHDDTYLSDILNITSEIYQGMLVDSEIFSDTYFAAGYRLSDYLLDLQTKLWDASDDIEMNGNHPVSPKDTILNFYKRITRLSPSEVYTYEYFLEQFHDYALDDSFHEFLNPELIGNTSETIETLYPTLSTEEKLEYRNENIPKIIKAGTALFVSFCSFETYYHLDLYQYCTYADAVLPTFYMLIDFMEAFKDDNSEIDEVTGNLPNDWYPNMVWTLNDAYNGLIDLYSNVAGESAALDYYFDLYNTLVIKDEKAAYINDLLSQIDDLNDTIDGLESDISDLNDIIDGFDDTLNDLNGQIQDLNDIIDDRDSTIDDLNGQISDLNDEIDDRGSTIDDLNGQISDLNDEIDDRDNTINGLNTQINSLTNQVNSLNAQINSLNSTIAGLEETIEEYEETINSLNSQLTTKNAEIQSLTNELNSYKSQLEVAQRSVNNFSARIDELQGEINRLNSLVANYEGTYLANEEQLESNRNLIIWLIRIIAAIIIIAGGLVVILLDKRKRC